MEQRKDYYVLLYYCYTSIAEPELYRDAHHQLCLDLNLRGRIIIAPEGLNGTVSGLKQDCIRYMEAVKADARFADIDFKVDEHHEVAFRKLHVRHKPEIVHSDLTWINPRQKTGIHLSPAAFKALKNREDVILVDMRSTYEHSIGRFKGAITLDLDNFRDLPEKWQVLADFKNKKIITYCTGGIKCEKASAFLLEQGFTDVYQLHGGIIKYGMEEGGEDFEGKCYVFDGRVAIDVNKVNPSVISTCYVCGSLSEHMVNCANATCNRHTVICEGCMEKMQGCCSEACQQSPDRRDWNPEGYYPSNTNGYNPYKCSKRAKAGS